MPWRSYAAKQTHAKFASIAVIERVQGFLLKEMVVWQASCSQHIMMGQQMQIFLREAGKRFEELEFAMAREVGAQLGLVPDATAAPADHAPPPALQHLKPALAAPDADPLVATLQPLITTAPWTEGEFAMPSTFAGRFAFVELVGPAGLIAHEQIRFGLYLQSPNTFYPSHMHEAEEIYYVLSGAAEWQCDDDAFAVREPGTPIHHKPWQRHAMRTDNAPLLAIWAWRGAIARESYRMLG